MPCSRRTDSWAVAELVIGVEPAWGESFLLLATPSATVASARVSLFCERGVHATRDYALSGHRTTLWWRQEFPGLIGRCAAMVESLPMAASPEAPGARVPLVVEAAMYELNFASGGVTLVTRLPDPPP